MEHREEFHHPHIGTRSGRQKTTVLEHARPVGHAVGAPQRKPVLIEDRLHQLVGEHRDRVEHLFARRRGRIDHVGGDLDGFVLRSEVGLVGIAPDQRFHLDEVDEAFEVRMTNTTAFE